MDGCGDGVATFSQGCDVSRVTQAVFFPLVWWSDLSMAVQKDIQLKDTSV